MVNRYRWPGNPVEYVAFADYEECAKEGWERIQRKVERINELESKLEEVTDERDGARTALKSAVARADSALLRLDRVREWLACSPMSERLTIQRCDELLDIVGRPDELGKITYPATAVETSALKCDHVGYGVFFNTDGEICANCLKPLSEQEKNKLATERLHRIKTVEKPICGITDPIGLGRGCGLPRGHLGEHMYLV